MLPTLSARKTAIARQLRGRSVPMRVAPLPRYRVTRGRRSFGGPMIQSRPGGDPGLFSFVTDIVKAIPGVGSVVSAVETGVKAVGGLLGGKPAVRTQAGTSPVVTPKPSIFQRLVGGSEFGLQVPTPLGPIGLEAGVEEIAQAGQLLRRNGRGAGLPPAGYHWNKAGYYVQDPSDPMRGLYVPPGSRAVRNRRRNPFNPRALDRATARIAQFARADSRSRKAVVAAARKVTPPRRVAVKRRR